MKKIMAVLTVLMCFASTNAFAQLKEVRGVQTRVVEYRNNDGEDRHGFEFKNENSYPVWVEAELCTQGFTSCYHEDKHVKGGTRDTKSFTLNAGETYIWKCGDRMFWPTCYEWHDFYDRFYVTYKAYKAE